MSAPVSNSFRSPVPIAPLDQYNQRLVERLHPPDWINPEPARRYDLVVVGGGAAGLVTAGGAALLGAKVALVEKHLLGGDCTNVGCVPSKTLIRSARVAETARSAADYGIETGAVKVNFAAVMERLRRIRSDISVHDSARRFQDEFGVDVFFGMASFADSDRITVAGKTLCFKKAVLATGSYPSIPLIPGLDAAGYLTNETVFSITDRPANLAIIGGGYIGCEMAQTFQRLGSQVALFVRGDRLLSQEDPDASEIIRQQLEQAGIQILLNSKILGVNGSDTGKTIEYEQNQQAQKITIDEILVATGRSVNVDGMNLDRVNVEYSDKGIVVNDYLQTTNPRIYAVGDSCLKWKFTHAANAAARVLLQNALFAVGGIGRKNINSLVMPYTVYTEPEVAHVGMHLAEIQAQNIPVETLCQPLTKVDRAVVDSETIGFAKVHLKRGTDRILGATIVSPQAGELITLFTQAMTNGLGLKAIAKTIYPYPTQAELIRNLADEYSIRQLQSLKPITSRWLAWTHGG
ncbi:mercuric reductase [Leptolyngbya sp. FACHB-711]|uniref:mercuric reductase n=1 Tax=unclassified Leptolyngbya TaxID=2650499 RepID=UPI001686FA09|nr:mercuric reductase [Leptolyngbya sp. FACHB-711]MBD1852118.1 mercuric reductase [Cyanobacteria bacterium FACHB-502]MBD2026429.1 mercuric reductase [Leptolyngbya sp. FACHB-711]